MTLTLICVVVIIGAIQNDGYSCGYRSMMAISRLYTKVVVKKEYPTIYDSTEGFFAFSETLRSITSDEVLQFQMDLAALMLMVRNYHARVEAKKVSDDQRKKEDDQRKKEEDQRKKDDEQRKKVDEQRKKMAEICKKEVERRKKVDEQLKKDEQVKKASVTLKEPPAEASSMKLRSRSQTAPAASSSRNAKKRKAAAEDIDDEYQGGDNFEMDNDSDNNSVDNSSDDRNLSNGKKLSISSKNAKGKVNQLPVGKRRKTKGIGESNIVVKIEAIPKKKREKRKVSQPPSTPVHLKDEKVRPKALSISKTMKKMHTLTTFVNEDCLDAHPSSNHFYMIEDSVVKRPHLAKNKIYARAEGPCFGFLVPPGESSVTLGPKLKNIGQAMIDEDMRNCFVTHDPAELHEYIYGPPVTRNPNSDVDN